MGANDHATGAYCAETFNPADGLGYIENEKQYTVDEKDSIWTHRALNWIKEHPKTYAILTIKKLRFLYHEAATFFFTYKDVSPDGRVSYSAVHSMRAVPFDSPFIFLNTQILGCHFFYLLIALSVAGLFLYARKSPKLMMLYLPVLICTATTIATVGDTRYNIIMQPLIIITAAYTLHRNKDRLILFAKALLK